MTLRKCQRLPQRGPNPAAGCLTVQLPVSQTVNASIVACLSSLITVSSDSLIYCLRSLGVRGFVPVYSAFFMGRCQPICCDYSHFHSRMPPHCTVTASGPNCGPHAQQPPAQRLHSHSAHGICSVAGVPDACTWHREHPAPGTEHGTPRPPGALTHICPQTNMHGRYAPHRRTFDIARPPCVATCVPTSVVSASTSLSMRACHAGAPRCWNLCAVIAQSP